MKTSKNEKVAKGPLSGVRIIEFAGLGPAPFAGMLLADLGADVVRIERETAGTYAVSNSPLDRGRRSVVLDLKTQEAKALCLKLIEKADVLIEGYRPGVMERLGLGPEIALERNPALIYGRMTGWGQAGPLAETAGHDITYLALTGALAAMGPAAGPPVPPLQLIGDMGGGGAFLVIGVLAALFERGQSGRGQVIDAAILDGTAAQMALILGLRAGGLWDRPRGQNLLDGGAPFYRTYLCADDKFIAVGAIEPKFYEVFVRGLGLDPAVFLPRQNDRAAWPEQHRQFEDIIIGKTRDEWAQIFDGTDACVTPVLDWDEAVAHPHNLARGTFERVEGAVHPSAAPRFSRSVVETRAQPQAASIEEILASWDAR